MRYPLNYDWWKLGPTLWTEESIVTLQIDLESYERAGQLWGAIDGWWTALEHDAATGADYAYEGGARMGRPTRIDGRITLRIYSSGQDAFDTIEYYANQVHDLALAVDPEVVIVWTELPHTAPSPE